MNILSPYANKKFIEFIKNKSIQETINNIIVFTGVTSIDYIEEIYMTMFLSTVEINKLNKTDLELLKKEILNIRSVEVIYPIAQQNDLPEPTDNFIISEVLKRTGNI